MKTRVSKPPTPAQIKAIHAILNELGVLDQKAEYILAQTKGRTESVKELTQDEVNEFFELFTLQKEKTLEQRRSVYRAIWKTAWLMGIIYGDTPEDFEMNKAKLNKFCRERGTVKANLNEMSLMELRKTHIQFEAMLSKYNKSRRQLT